MTAKHTPGPWHKGSQPHNGILTCEPMRCRGLPNKPSPKRKENKMPKPMLTHKMAIAAGLDAGNRNMKKNNRLQWNEEDWNKAAKVTNRLLDKLDKKET